MPANRGPALPSTVDEKRAPAPFIFGCAGTGLTADELRFFKDADPLGFILFARNIEDPKQLRALTDRLRDSVGRDAPVLIDQEGGRVRRMKPPHWNDLPSARSFGDLHGKEPERAGAALADAMRVLADELKTCGINVDCVPVLDLGFGDTTPALLDRTYGDDPATVAALGKIACETLTGAGIVPVMKHIPGHGRAVADSHHELPVIDADLEALAQADFLPFRAMLDHAYTEGLWGMVAHVTYSAIDPNLPATCSRKVIHDVIRKTIGFQGLLLSDDIDMGALAFIGGPNRRAAQALRAGCDVVLQCNGVLADMQSVAAKGQKMTVQAVARYNRSVSWLQPAA